MAGLLFTVEGFVENLDADPDTIIQITTGANRRIVVRHIILGGVLGTPATIPAEVYWAVQTNDGTKAGDVTPTKFNTQDGETLQSSTDGSFWGGPFSANPTYGTKLARLGSLHEQGGIDFYPTPDERLVIPGSSTRALVVERGSTISVAYWMLCEE